ncbi:Ku protein [Fervidibacillus albus]|uniref:Non-homologous end joining protein Ku n=1 Tax=Fervidibacillus albus TaxID=2980026 RepID=A0A9E8LX25_9BACI|nr:Ku protein [Fervidibacillus albus]WAA11047.1 Ku protein [Fervidibacillus albus]
MHTIWKGSIRFGLVNIPVKLHTATEDKDISFRHLHQKCHTPIKYEKICPNCDVTVSKDEIVKAYEYSKGKFIVLEEEELKGLEKEREDKAVEILDFVKMTDIDPIYFKRSYYLSPNEGGGKAYSLLRKALEKSEKVGIAKITIRAKEQLAVIRVYENTLLMETIHYPDEVKDAKDVPKVPAANQISKKELDTAILLIDQLTTEFEPGNYTDEYREEIFHFIEAKKAGKETVTPERKETANNVTDLMAALQASIDRTKREKKPDRSNTRKSTRAKKKA